MQSFDTYLTVRSTEWIPSFQEEGPAVLVKAASGPNLVPPDGWRLGNISVFLVVPPGAAPTPGDELKITVEHTTSAVRGH